MERPDNLVEPNLALESKLNSATITQLFNWWDCQILPTAKESYARLWLHNIKQARKQHRNKEVQYQAASYRSLRASQIFMHNWLSGQQDDSNASR